MLYTDYILKERAGTILHETERMRNFNQQITDTYIKHMEILEKELLELSGALFLNEYIVDENKQGV